MNSEIINNALEFVKKHFESSADGHDFDHTLRVYKTAVKLAEKEKADINLTAVCALLHDVDDRKLSPQTSKNLDNARRFLKSQNVNKDETEKIIKIISEISFKGTDSVTPETAEGKCVQDADRLDAMGAVGIARAFCYGASKGRKIYDPEIKPVLNMSGEEYIKNENSTTVNHFYEKLFLLKDMMNTETAREIAKKRDSFMHEFLDEFFNEINVNNL